MNVDLQRRNGHFYLYVGGEVTDPVVDLVATTLGQEYTGTGNIFINTESVACIGQNCPKRLLKLIKDLNLPEERLYCIGEKGFELGDHRLKVIVRPPKKARCTGCKKEKAASLNNVLPQALPRYQN